MQARVLEVLALLAEGFVLMEKRMADLSSLSTAVDNLTSTSASVVNVLQGLVQEVQALKAGTVDQATIDGIAARVTDAVNSLQAAAASAAPAPAA